MQENGTKEDSHYLFQIKQEKSANTSTDLIETLGAKEYGKDKNNFELHTSWIFT